MAKNCLRTAVFVDFRARKHHARLLLLFFAIFAAPAILSEEDNPYLDQRSTTIVLGCVMAHEFGHLLLGARHSVAGIMQTHWGSEQTELALMRKLTFLPEQIKLIQAAALDNVPRKDADAAAFPSH